MGTSLFGEYHYMAREFLIRIEIDGSDMANKYKLSRSITNKYLLNVK